MLVLLCAGPGAADGALRAAAAIELVHMATLVHDDVLDAAPLRRGLPTVVATSGRERATAVGDLLLSRAFAELGGNGGGGGHRQVELLARASVGLALGELAQRRDAFDLAITAERYRERCLLKTARLFECACLIGRAAADPDPAAEALTVFGREIGLAFQLLDDVLDVAGPPERTGKARGTDLLDGTVTLPLILARERDPALAALDLRALDAAGAEAACERIAATGALEEVRADARERVEKAKRVVAEAPGAGRGAAAAARPGRRRRRRALRLGPEVFGDDQVGFERRDEPLDLLFHVRAGEQLEVVEHRLHAVVERLVEAVDQRLVVDAAAAPLALGAAERDAPLALSGGRPIEGIDEVAPAAGADARAHRDGEEERRAVRGRHAGARAPLRAAVRFCAGRSLSASLPSSPALSAQPPETFRG